MRGMSTVSIQGRDDLKNMLLRLEDEYRKASISEKNYAELKEKYSKMLEKIDKEKKMPDDKDNKDVEMKKEERKDLEMFIESLDEQYEKGEINKKDYDNIKNVNMQRLKEIEDGLGDEKKDYEIEIEVKSREKEGVFKKLFGRIKKKKREEGKLEVEVPDDLPAPDEHVEETAPAEPENEEVEIEVKKGLLHGIFGKKGEKKIEVGVPEENKDDVEKEEAPPLQPEDEETVKEVDETVKEEHKDKVEEHEEKEEDSPKETDSEVKAPEEKEAEQKLEEEKPKKSGFLKSMFKKKDKKKDEPKEDTPKEGQKAETKPEEPKEEPKEEKKEEKLEPGEIEEVTPEVIEKLAEQMAESSGASTENVETAPEEESEEESALPSDNKLAIEIEKLKVMIDTIRDSKKSSDENMQNISENIGEIRSMVMQSDANFKTTIANMERLEGEVTDIKPKEISKKFNEIKESMEKDRLEVEKLQKKSEGTNEKVNEIYEMIKSIGGVENLINLNNDIQTKLKDINEAIKYIQRIGAKTEKIFIDLSKGMEDLVLLKAKQEDFDESIKNALTSIDSLNVKLKDYVSKSDMEDIKGEIVMVKKQMDEIKKVLPIAELKLPENMIKLRKDKEDIEMFLDSLESQHIEGKINKAEYEELKKINVKKLNDVESKLEKEWKDIDRVMKPSEEEGETSEDVQGGIVKKKKARRSKTSKKKAKKERDRKKKILKDLKING
jgi:hypothetical protein